jgi:hypothetical protein
MLGRHRAWRVGSRRLTRPAKTDETETSAEMNAEQTRLREAREPSTPWRKWGPYLSERQSRRPGSRAGSRAPRRRVAPNVRTRRVNTRGRTVLPPRGSYCIASLMDPPPTAGFSRCVIRSFTFFTTSARGCFQRRYPVRGSASLTRRTTGKRRHVPSSRPCSADTPLVDPRPCRRCPFWSGPVGAGGRAWREWAAGVGRVVVFLATQRTRETSTTSAARTC